MVTSLSVLNQCLAIMGEVGLNTLAEPHGFKASILALLSRVSTRIQSSGNMGTGWWFNMENLTLTPSPADNRVYLPGDTGTILPFIRKDVAQRGRVLYDLVNGTDQFEQGEEFKIVLVRVLALEDIPASVANYIEAQVMLEFQNDYDGDQTKTRNMMAMLQQFQATAQAEHIRNRNVNLILTSERLSRITNRVAYARRPR